jgi:predicted GNAT family N-acyltransferase
MKSVTLRVAFADELDWVNSKYQQIDFALCNEETTLIVVAEIDGSPAGLGRLHKMTAQCGELGGIYVFPAFRGQGIAHEIVKFLIEQNSFEVLYCLPFAHLKRFYMKFGFDEPTLNEEASKPPKISAKLDWCKKTYEDKSILLIHRN